METMNKLLDFLWNVFDKACELLIDINDWYKDKIEELACKYNFSKYNMAWIGFLKGVAVVLLIQWIF
tara:strand:- start:1610 stop:1810 length:201 start_codon:yes stop_codon:yes gene_type:complete